MQPQPPILFNPYPGLQSFSLRDKDLFFGRENQVSELLNVLSKIRFLVVVGNSGSGKSSLVQAGLLPAIHSAENIFPGKCH